MTRAPNRRRWRLLAAAAALVPALAMINPGVANAQTSPTTPAWFEANNNTATKHATWAPLTWSGTAAYAPTAELQGFAFDGSNGLYSSDPALGAFGTNDFTVQFDVDTTASGTEVLSHRGGELGANCGNLALWQVNILPNGVAHLFLEIGPQSIPGNSFGLSSPVVVDNGKWHTVRIHRSGLTVSMTVDGTETSSGTLPSNFDLGSGGPLTFEVANGDACAGSLPNAAPFVGTLDNIYLGDQPPTDLSITQPSVPVVPAGGSGSVTVDLHNPSAADVANVTYGLNAGGTPLTITGVSGLPGCTFAANAVNCLEGDTSLPAGTTPLTIDFTLASDAAPGSTISVTQALTDQVVPDPNHYNDTYGVAAVVQVAPVNGGPLADLWVVGGVLGLLALVAGGWLTRRRVVAARP